MPASSIKGKTAGILVIGDEILSGHTLDTNSHFLSKELQRIGIPVSCVLKVADDISAVVGALSFLSERADFTFTTGGLGPTRDDKTKMALQEFFSQPLRFDEPTYEHLAKFFESRGRDAAHLALNRPQAEVLREAIVIQNDHGTAPCMQIEKNGKYFWILPGVPFEVKPLFRDKIKPILLEMTDAQVIESRIITVVGVPESVLSQKLEAWEQALPKNVAFGYLPVGNRIRLKLVATGKNGEDLQQQLTVLAESLKPIIGDFVLSWHGETIAEIFLDMMRCRNLNVGIAESFTGGQLVQMLVAQPGASEVVRGSLVAYQTEVKVNVLSIPSAFIEKHNVASAEVAEAMAQAAAQKFETKVGFGTTGVAGPMGDGSGVPVGTVFYSIYHQGEFLTNKLYLPHMDRQDLMKFAAQRALQDATAWLQEKGR